MTKQLKKHTQTQKNEISIPNSGSKWPRTLLIIYLIEVIILGINPYNREVWLAENLTALIPVTVLIFFYFRNIRFSNTAYTLMAIFFITHTVGGYYTFERVPIMPLMDLLGFSRNHFDRACHFMVGFFAFALLEYSDSQKLIKGKCAAAFFVIMSVFGFAAIFELVEWIYAELANNTNGLAFLGSQGDIWDAQKDMLADGLGAIFTTVLYGLLRWRKQK